MTPVMVGVERRADKSDFGAVLVVAKMNQAAVQPLVARVAPSAAVRSEAHSSLNLLDQAGEHAPQVNLPKPAGP